MKIKQLFKPLRLTGALLAIGVAPSALSAVTCEVTNWNSWGSGYVVDVEVTGSGSANGWSVDVVFGSNPSMSNGWNASFAASGNKVTASNIGWNGNLSNGQSVSFGFQGTGNVGEPTCVSGSTQTSSTQTSSVAPTPSSSSQASTTSSTPAGPDCVEMCKWYQDDPRPLCQSATGWGYENGQSCIGRTTCEAQSGNGGIVNSCGTQTSSVSSVTPPPSSSSSSVSSVTPPSSSSSSVSSVTPPSSSSSSVSSVTPPSSSSSSVSSLNPGEYPARVDNPYAGAKVYVNPKWSELAEGEPEGYKISNEPTFVWLDRISAIAPDKELFPDAWGLVEHLDEALAQGADVFQFVFYDLPNRDCAALASNGELRISENGMQRYKDEYTKGITDILSNPKYASLRIVAVVEVDSLPNLITNLDTPDCAEANDPEDGYRGGIKHALNELSKIPNVYSYLDIAHSGWLGWPENFDKGITLIGDVVLSTDKKWDSLAGFASNTANYTPTEEPFLADPSLRIGNQELRSADYYEWNPYFDEIDFVTDWRAAMISRKGAPSSLGMLIDTGRNGWGGPNRPTSESVGSSVNSHVELNRVDGRLHRGNWCNQPGGVGYSPQANPHPGIDAYVWVKPQGESDGISDPNFPIDPMDPAKQHDPMCAPDHMNSGQGQLSGAMDNAPHAGRWFPEAFQVLLQNAYPER